MAITLDLPWLRTLPLSALLDTLPPPWVVGEEDDGRPTFDRSRDGAMILESEWVPVPGFADYGRRVAEVVQAVIESHPDPLAYLNALHARRDQPESPESLALAEKTRAAWARPR